MAIGNIVEDLMEPNSIWLNCAECLYGNWNDCPKGVKRLCSEYLGWEYNMAVANI